jgi:hypothetical protein
MSVTSRNKWEIRYDWFKENDFLFEKSLALMEED